MAKKIIVEPWMKEFMKQRHTQEEWDAFFVYCEAGPWKRAFILFATLSARILGLI